MFESLFNYLQIKTKSIFLIDGLGALLTFGLLKGLVSPNEAWFGVPEAIVEILAWTAAGFALFSFFVYTFICAHYSRWLTAIAIANSMYCVLSLGFLIYCQARVTWLGWVYFMGEIGVVLFLVRVEVLLIRAQLFEQTLKNPPFG